jgi:C1A family cysteine protease
MKDKKAFVGVITVIFILILTSSINTNIYNIAQNTESICYECQKPASSKTRLRYTPNLNKEEVPDSEREKVVSTLNLGDTFDWRNNNGEDWTTKIKDQGSCGSCTAFAIAAAIEAKINIQNDDPDINRDLSEAHLYFCTGHICSWGAYIKDLLYYAKNYGISDEGSFPYDKARSGLNLECDLSEDWKNNGVWISGWRWVYNDVNSIKNALVEHGPLVASMLGYENFKKYGGGVYTPDGDPVRYHCVVIVGYDDLEDYWICKNSWGTWWGEDGWFRIKYGVCRIEDAVAYIKNVYRFNPDNPDIPTKPSGPTSVEKNDYCDYVTVSSDPNDDMIRYLWDFNSDDIIDYETEPVSSGEKYTLTHMWEKNGKYSLRVRAEDELGLLSDWSEPLTVKVSNSRNKVFSGLFHHFLQHIFARFNFVRL